MTNVKNYIQSIDKYSEDAKEILTLYEDIIEEKKKIIIKEIIGLKKPKLVLKIKCIFSSSYNFGILRYTLRFKLAILLKH